MSSSSPRVSPPPLRLSIIPTVIAIFSILPLTAGARDAGRAIPTCGPTLEADAKHPWLAAAPPADLWESPRQVRAYFDWLRATVPLPGNDWFTEVTEDMIIRHHGAGLLTGESLRQILGRAHPEQFAVSFRNKKWQDPADRLTGFRQLGALKGWTTLEDWYQFKVEDLTLIGRGSTLMGYYGSRVAILKFVFPGTPIEAWRFDTTPARYWAKRENRLAFFSTIEKRLALSTNEEWYALPARIFNGTGGESMFTRYYGSSFFKMLNDLKPEFAWDPERFFRDDLKSQRELFDTLKDWLPCVTLSWNHKFKEIRFAKSRRAIEIDIFLPDLGLGIEYQGAQHYRPVEFFGGARTFKAQQARDVEKKHLFEATGRPLVEVPYTWDKSLGQLKEILTDRLGAAHVERLDRRCH